MLVPTLAQATFCRTGEKSKKPQEDREQRSLWRLVE